MKKIGTIKDYPQLKRIYEAIFQNTKSQFTIKNFKEGLKAIDHGGLRYVQQNPNTGSKFAAQARNGSKIIWVIRTHNKITDAAGRKFLVPCNNQYVGRIQDGDVYK